MLFVYLTGVWSEHGGCCHIFGSQHIFTFDKQRIDFNSDLAFTVAKTCPLATAVGATFDITVQNEYKYSNIDSVSRVKCVSVLYKGYTAEICSDQTASVSTVRCSPLNSDSRRTHQICSN